MRKKTLVKMEKIQLVILSILIVALFVGAATLIIKGKEFVNIMGNLDDRVSELEETLGVDADEVKEEEVEKEMEKEVEKDVEKKDDEVSSDDKTDSGWKKIEIASPEHNQTLKEEPVVFTGKVSPNTDKIVVNALVTSTLGQTHNAIYTIKDFELGDTEFVYTSKKEWNNLVEGINNYTFTAYYADGSEESTSLTVYFEE